MTHKLLFIFLLLNPVLYIYVYVEYGGESAIMFRYRLPRTQPRVNKGCHAFGAHPSRRMFYILHRTCRAGHTTNGKLSVFVRAVDGTQWRGRVRERGHRSAEYSATSIQP